MAKYLYFTATGKWKYDGEGESIPTGYVGVVNHDFLIGLNGGRMPGITTDGKDYTIVIIDEGTYPRMAIP